MKTSRTRPDKPLSPGIAAVIVIAAVAVAAVLVIGVYVAVNLNALIGFVRYVGLAYGEWG
jgi:hypothetical protein